MPLSPDPVAEALAQAARNIARADALRDHASRVLAQSWHCVQAMEVLGAALSEEAAPDLDAVREALQGLTFEAPAAGRSLADAREPVISPPRSRRRVGAGLV